MDIQCIYDSPREACKAVLELYISSTGKNRLFAIQYNRYLSQSTTWWLSPVGVNPAYKYGKFGFVPCRELPCALCADGEIMVGLYVEKGLGREARPRTQIMDSSWFWHTFLDEIKTEQFSSALSSIQSEAGVQPEIYIESFTGSQKDCILFQWGSSDGKLHAMRNEFRGTALENMAHISDLYSLVTCLRDIPHEPYVWIDLMIGIRLGLHGHAAHSWDAWSIEMNLLRYLEPWVR
ncbi:MAG TPA: hypothetical protein PK250_07620 [Syntrophobacter fumaroxidans]|nr:hypothetical protein [Syntrophobacter fumaroxidans]